MIGANRLRVRVITAVSCVAALFLVPGCGGSSNASNSQTSSVTIVATVPPPQLAIPGRLEICSDIPSPPFEQYDTKGNLVGLDVDMGNEMARRLGLTPGWVNSVFDTIIEALQSGKCDTIISSMYITPDRQKQIDQIPYFTAGESFLVAKGNPSHIDSSNPMSLCGLSISTEIGAAEVDDLNQFDQGCRAAGKAAISILQATKLTDALQQLQTGHAVALFFDSPTNSYFVSQHPDQFGIGGGILKPINYGIGVGRDKPNLKVALIAALKSEQSDGFFTKILSNWGQTGTPIPPPE